MNTVRETALNIVRSSDYVARWFNASNFFNTIYTSKILKGSYFITCDNFMTSKIWALRHITGDGIDTVVSGDTEQLCLDALEEAGQ